jgi:hypothetical protein
MLFERELVVYHDTQIFLSLTFCQLKDAVVAFLGLHVVARFRLLGPKLEYAALLRMKS